MALPAGFMGAAGPVTSRKPGGLVDLSPGPAKRPVGLLVIVHAEKPLSPPANFWPSPEARKLFDRPFTVDRDHTPPYVAGYSNDGHTIFIHRDFPASMTVGTHAFDPEPFVVEHERVEKAILDWTAMQRGKPVKYKTAHSDYATEAEHDALKAQLGFTPADIRSYDAQVSALAQKIARLPNSAVPKNMDTQPYRDTGTMRSVAPDKQV